MTAPTSSASGGTAGASTPKMRSSIACARCRRSKVKCVNSGVHTTCRACESSGRECLYPVPGGGGQVIAATSSSSAAGGDGAQIIGGTGGSAGIARPRPKKPTTGGAGGGSFTGGHGLGGAGSSGLVGGVRADGGSGSGGKAKAGSAGGTGPSAAAAAAAAAGAGNAFYAPVIYGALVEGTGIPPAEDVLNDPNLTWQFWTNMHDHYKHHFSAELPFLHAPTFLSPNRLPKLPSQHLISRDTAQGDDKTSYPLCLGILTLMGRFYPPLMKLHQAYAQSVTPPAPAPTASKSGKQSTSATITSASTSTSEGRKIGEFYAAVLRKHLFGPGPLSREMEVAVPTIEKVQALLMLAVHEWIGEGKAEKASLWVGLAGRMANILGLGRTEIVTTSTSPPGAAVSAAEDESMTGVDDTVAPGSLNGGGGDAEDGGLARKRRKLSTSSGGGASTSTCAAVTPEKEKKELIIQEEIARRTFWSIFMLDRALTKGSRKDLCFRLEDTNGDSDAFYAANYAEEDYDEEGERRSVVVKLPCSDAAFLFGQKVQTDVLRIGGDASSQSASARISTGIQAGATESGVVCQVGEKEGELSRIIRGMEIWGRVRRWRGPRSSSSPVTPPAELATGTPPPGALQVPPRSFYVLRDLIQAYASPLPANLAFSPDNLNAHIHSKSSTSYAIIHVINFLSRMVLNKYSMPFIPPQHTPASELQQYTNVAAREIFRSARGVLDLVKGLTDWNVGVETPLVGYAVYVAGFWAVYAAAWPTMDEEAQLADTSVAEENNPHVQTAISQLRRFTARWCLGGGDGRRWSAGLIRLGEFYRRVKSGSVAPSSPPATKGSGAAAVGASKMNGVAVAAAEKPLAGEYARFEKMMLELGRDEVAGWVESLVATPPPGLAAPRRTSGEGARKRPSPQPPQQRASGQQLPHQQQQAAAASDRWIAINKSPSINPSTPPAQQAPQPQQQPSPQTGYSPSSQQQQQGQPNIDTLISDSSARTPTTAAPPPPPPPPAQQTQPHQSRLPLAQTVSTPTPTTTSSTRSSYPPASPTTQNQTSSASNPLASPSRKRSASEMEGEGEVSDDGVTVKKEKEKEKEVVYHQHHQPKHRHRDREAERIVEKVQRAQQGWGEDAEGEEDGEGEIEEEETGTAVKMEWEEGMRGK